MTDTPSIVKPHSAGKYIALTDSGMNDELFKVLVDDIRYKCSLAQMDVLIKSLPRLKQERLAELVRDKLQLNDYVTFLVNFDLIRLILVDSDQSASFYAQQQNIRNRVIRIVIRDLFHVRHQIMDIMEKIRGRYYLDLTVNNTMRVLNAVAVAAQRSKSLHVSLKPFVALPIVPASLTDIEGAQNAYRLQYETSFAIHSTRDDGVSFKRKKGRAGTIQGGQEQASPG